MARQVATMTDEIGATAGSTHAKILEQTLGRERAQRALVKGGAPAPQE